MPLRRGSSWGFGAFGSVLGPDPYPRSAPDGQPVPNPVLLGRAFTELIERYPTDRLPQSGGLNATLVVTIPLDTLLGGLRSAELLTGDHVSPGTARRLASVGWAVKTGCTDRSAIADASWSGPRAEATSATADAR